MRLGGETGRLSVEAHWYVGCGGTKVSTWGEESFLDTNLLYLSPGKVVNVCSCVNVLAFACRDFCICDMSLRSCHLNHSHLSGTVSTSGVCMSVCSCVCVSVSVYMCVCVHAVTV